MFGVFWEDQLWRGQPVYLIVIVPADASTEADIMEDLAKSAAAVGHAVAVLRLGGGWQREGTAARSRRINARDIP